MTDTTDTKTTTKAKPKPTRRTTTKKPLGANKASPLPKPPQTKKEPKKVTTIGTDNKTKKLKNFRLRPIDIERLAEMTGKVDDLSDYTKIKEIDILQALLYIGDKMDSKKLLNACKESKF